METIILIIKNPVVLISLLIMTIFKSFPPKSINSWYGYRTAKSRTSKPNWDFAQGYSANLSLILLFPLLLFQILLYAIYSSTALIDLSIITCWLLSFGIVIYKTEKKLKQITPEKK
ncbi:SdpI family protein [Flavobacterium sp. FlaQc-48]|uniref:SdpI family protein n=1 Tax=Flavobacterium sp. FlaQc-48 TaxID=3374181 RepID=UPI003756BAB4